MQFKNDFRGGYQFVAYDLASKFRSRYKLYDKFLRYTWGVFILVKLVLISRQVWRVVLIKNTNITLQKIIYFFFKGRCALDINDPIHLQFDNKHTQELFLNTDLLILENQSLLNCYESLNPNIVVNEDYPYTEDLQVGSSARENIILWYGSKETVFHLEKITSIIQKVLDNSEYRMVLLGVNKLPKGLKNKVSILENYDYKILKSNLKKCKIVLAPFKDTQDALLRGNMKAKIGMASGACVVAEDVAMHQKIIKSKLNGLLCSDKDTWLNTLMNLVHDDKKIKKISSNALEYSCINFTKKKYISTLINALESLK